MRDCSCATRQHPTTTWRWHAVMWKSASCSTISTVLFVPAPQENEHYHSDGSWDVRNTVVLLQGLLPHYKKYNPERCHWLSGLLLKTIEQRGKQGAHTKELFSDLEPDIRSYHEATKFVEP